MAQERTQVSSPKPLVLDANILIRAVFGVQVRNLLERFEDVAAFFSPDVCFLDAERYIPSLAQRGVSIPQPG
jgi:hypothetical protein